MKILFAGTPSFAATILRRLDDAGYEVVGVLTQPDRPSGRGLCVTPSAVKQFAAEKKWAIFQPHSFKGDALLETFSALSALGAELMVVAAYGKILPRPLLTLTPLGAINVHASLLPRWRGAAPIERALAEGDSETGISIMQMTEGLDEGPVYRQDALFIDPHETACELEERLALLGGESLLHVLNLLPDLHPQPQHTEGITYANKITTQDGHINLHQSAEAVYRHIRAFATSPGCFLMRGDGPSAERLRIGAAHWPIDTPTPPPPPGARVGDVVGIDKHGVLLQCADGPIRLIALQRPGRKMMAAVQVINGWRIGVGDSLITDSPSSPSQDEGENPFDFSHEKPHADDPALRKP